MIRILFEYKMEFFAIFLIEAALSYDSPCASPVTNNTRNETSTMMVAINAYRPFANLISRIAKYICSDLPLDNPSIGGENERKMNNTLHLWKRYGKERAFS